MLTKYWADAVHTVVYTQNHTLSLRQPKIIPAKAWFGQRQNTSHLRPFGATGYAHISLDLNMSKLSPRSVKVSLLGYHGCNGYKLIDKSTGTIYKSRDVIFEEGQTHIAKPLEPIILDEDKDPFTLETLPNSDWHLDKSEKRMPSIQGIAPRPLGITIIHKNGIVTQHPVPSQKDILLVPMPDNQQEQQADLPLAVRRPRHEPNPTT